MSSPIKNQSSVNESAAKKTTMQATLPAKQDNQTITTLNNDMSQPSLDAFITNKVDQGQKRRQRKALVQKTAGKVVSAPQESTSTKSTEESVSPLKPTTYSDAAKSPVKVKVASIAHPVVEPKDKGSLENNQKHWPTLASANPLSQSAEAEKQVVSVFAAPIKLTLPLQKAAEKVKPVTSKPEPSQAVKFASVEIKSESASTAKASASPKKLALTVGAQQEVAPKKPATSLESKTKSSINTFNATKQVWPSLGSKTVLNTHITAQAKVNSTIGLPKKLTLPLQSHLDQLKKAHEAKTALIHSKPVSTQAGRTDGKSGNAIPKTIAVVSPSRSSSRERTVPTASGPVTMSSAIIPSTKSTSATNKVMTTVPEPVIKPSLPLVSRSKIPSAGAVVVQTVSDSARRPVHAKPESAPAANIVVLSQPTEEHQKPPVIASSTGIKQSIPPPATVTSSEKVTVPVTPVISNASSPSISIPIEKIDRSARKGKDLAKAEKEKKKAANQAKHKAKAEAEKLKQAERKQEKLLAERDRAEQLHQHKLAAGQAKKDEEAARLQEQNHLDSLQEQKEYRAAQQNFLSMQLVDQTLQDDMQSRRVALSQQATANSISIDMAQMTVEEDPVEAAQEEVVEEGVLAGEDVLAEQDVPVEESCLVEADTAAKDEAVQFQTASLESKGFVHPMDSLWNRSEDQFNANHQTFLTRTSLSEQVESASQSSEMAAVDQEVVEVQATFEEKGFIHPMNAIWKRSEEQFYADHARFMASLSNADDQTTSDLVFKLDCVIDSATSDAEDTPVEIVSTELVDDALSQESPPQSHGNNQSKGEDETDAQPEGKTHIPSSPKMDEVPQLLATLQSGLPMSFTLPFRQPKSSQQPFFRSSVAVNDLPKVKPAISNDSSLAQTASLKSSRSNSSSSAIIPSKLREVGFVAEVNTDPLEADPQQETPLVLEDVTAISGTSHEDQPLAVQQGPVISSPPQDDIVLQVDEAQFLEAGSRAAKPRPLPLGPAVVESSHGRNTSGSSTDTVVASPKALEIAMTVGSGEAKHESTGNKVLVDQDFLAGIMTRLERTEAKLDQLLAADSPQKEIEETPLNHVDQTMANALQFMSESMQKIGCDSSFINVLELTAKFTSTLPQRGDMTAAEKTSFFEKSQALSMFASTMALHAAWMQKDN